MSSGGEASNKAMVSVLGAGEIILVAVGGYYLSQVVGNNDTSNDLSKAIFPVIGILSGIVLVHTLLWYFYFTFHPVDMNMYFLVSGAFSMIISLTAICISLTNKS
jgi:hypothetical protein